MHEYAITQSMVDLVREEAKKAKAKKIDSISIVMGELSSVNAECIAMYFELLTKGTLLESSKLEFEVIPASLICSSCKYEYNKNKSNFECPKCGEMGKLTDKGKEFYVKNMTFSA